MNVLEQMVQESRGFVVVGIGRWHFHSVGQQDYYRAYYGNLVLLQPHVTKENADFQQLADDDPKKMQEWVKILGKMGADGQDRMAAYQKATVSAGLEGVSESAEKCAVAESIRQEDGNREALLAMSVAEADFQNAADDHDRVDAKERYDKAQVDVDKYVLARHVCGTKCFQSYRPIIFVPKRDDEKPAENKIHIDTIPPPTVTAIFSAIMAISDEGGRASKRVENFQPGPPADPRRDRKAIRQTTERARARRQP